SRVTLVPLNGSRVKGKILERIIRVPIQRGHGNFDLYYFARMPESGRAAKTVLFCPGGPGEFTLGPIETFTLADFLTENGYNVVYYHPRGAGLSQIPPSNQYDEFLKTSYVAKDLEAIRKDFLGDQNWDAVIGYSFGTVVAQQYAHVYRKLNRLILLGPMSRHPFNNPNLLNQITSEVRETNRRVLTAIFQYSEFASDSNAQKSAWVDRALGTASSNGIMQEAENKFGSISFISGAYCQLTASNLLATNALAYSQRFFKALAKLRLFGTSSWPPNDPFRNRQVEIARDIKEEFSGTGTQSPDCGPDISGSSERVFYVVSIYDGLNTRFLIKWLANGRTDIEDAVKASAGEVHYAQGDVNRFVNKIGITNDETVTPWDPARYKHDVPTMILKGGADPVPSGGAAEHIFLNALDGPRLLIEFPGVGHGYFLPIIQGPSTGSGPSACRPTASRILDCVIYSFMEIAGLSNDPPTGQILNTIVANDSSSKICFRNQSSSQTRSVNGICP
ncbi:MAG: alpha/beta fold hydrolase, partial [Candidatus Binatia bacterium]